MSKETHYVALLRGINTGAANKGRKSVPMAELRRLAEGLGWCDVSTYIQSGNLSFAASDARAKLEEQLASAITAHFAFDVPVIIRKVDELRKAAAACPFADAADDHPNLVHIGFATQRIRKAMAKEAFPYCTNGERIEVIGQVIWTDCPNGVGRSKLTPAVLDRAFGAPVTMRNVKTLRALT